MVFIKLQYKDNIKKILIAKEEINWQKICELLHQTFKLEDSNSIRLVYKDEEESIGEIEIKSNDQLLETINKKLIKKFIKFFVFYSGAVENDGDIMYTSLVNNKDKSQGSQNKSKGTNQGKGKKKSLVNIGTHKQAVSSNELNEQKSLNNTTDINDQQAKSTQNDNNQQSSSIRRNSTTSQLNFQKNSLIQVETSEQFKNILSQAINKSQVFEEIKDKIREFINDPSSQGQFIGGRLSEQKNNISNNNKEEEVEDLQKKSQEEIEYSIQTNLQHLSDLFVQNIREVIDEQLTRQLDLTTNFQKPPRKYSEDLFEKKKRPIKNNLTQIVNKEISSPLSPKGILKKKLMFDEGSANKKAHSVKTLPDEITDLEDKNESLTKKSNNKTDNDSNNNSNSCSINNNLNITTNSNNLSESIYTPTPYSDCFTSRHLKRKNTNSDRLLEIIQEQEQKISNIEDTLQKTQKVSEQQITKQFEQNFRSIHHLFQSISNQPQQTQQSENITPKSLKNDQMLSSVNNTYRNKTISAYELYLLLDKQVQQYSLPDQYTDDEIDLNTPSVFDSLINEQIILKSKHQRIRSKFFQQIEENKEEDLENQSPSLKDKLGNDELKITKNISNNQKQLLEDTIVQVVSPLRSFKLNQNDSKSMLQLIKTNHFNLNSESENNTPSNHQQINKQSKKSYKKQNSDSQVNCSPINHSSKEIIDEVDDDSDFDQNLPKLIMTKKISHTIMQNV